MATIRPRALAAPSFIDNTACISSTDDFDPSRDHPGFVEIPYGNNHFIVHKDGPHGFWFVKLRRGTVPHALSGMYTAMHYAVEAVNTFKNSKRNG